MEPRKICSFQQISSDQLGAADQTCIRKHSNTYPRETERIIYTQVVREEFQANQFCPVVTHALTLW